MLPLPPALALAPEEAVAPEEDDGELFCAGGAGFVRPRPVFVAVLAAVFVAVFVAFRAVDFLTVLRAVLEPFLRFAMD
jgi:hypothetical protein